MPDRIQINCERVEENAMSVENAAVYLQNVTLVPQDMKTTLPANANSKTAYERAQGITQNSESGNYAGSGGEKYQGS